MSATCLYNWLDVYLYDCRFRDECVCFHHFHHSLGHNGFLHACHVEAIYIVPECNAVLVLLCVPHSYQADVTKVWVHCGANKALMNPELKQNGNQTVY